MMDFDVSFPGEFIWYHTERKKESYFRAYPWLMEKENKTPTNQMREKKNFFSVVIKFSALPFLSFFFSFPLPLTPLRHIF
jgi:hypothetical protein